MAKASPTTGKRKQPKVAPYRVDIDFYGVEKQVKARTAKEAKDKVIAWLKKGNNLRRHLNKNNSYAERNP
jgi:hypothetical protein